LSLEHKHCDQIPLYFIHVDDIDAWVKEIKEAGGTCPIVVVGNKADIKKVGDADKTAKSNGCGYH
jgi:predicted enzyme related to lactoylglutathione lyase